MIGDYYKEENKKVREYIERMSVEDLRLLVFHLRRGTYIKCTDEDLINHKDKDWFDQSVIYDREKDIFLMPTEKDLIVPYE